MNKLIFSIFFCLTYISQAQENLILSQQKQAQVIDDILEERFTHILPAIMRQEGIDLWVIISREYNEDPVMKTMLPSEWLSARRRSIFLFYDNGTAVERIAIARYDVGNLLKGEWDLNIEPDQFKALNAYITSKNPKKIGLNYSVNYAHADGISKTEHGLFMAALSPSLQNKVVSAENLAVRWLETRTAKEMEIYEHISKISHQIIADAFSSKVIQAGITSTEDVVWYMRQRVSDLGLDTWFHPTVDIQRADQSNFDHLRAFSKKPKEGIIKEGDLLHCDFGITYLRLNTDHQQLAYMPKPGESQPPQFLREAFKKGTLSQDMLTKNFKKNLSGNQILANALQDCKAAGLKSTIYTHPIGSHGHAAGPTVGMWDNQGVTPGAGDFPLHPNTCYSIELNAAVEISEWKKTIRIMLEEDAFFDGETMRYIDGRQMEIRMVR